VIWACQRFELVQGHTSVAGVCKLLLTDVLQDALSIVVAVLLCAERAKHRKRAKEKTKTV
jgi:hypothetical protein